MNESGHISREVLSSLVDGECSSSQRRTVHEHLQGCAECRQCVKEFTEVQSLVSRLPALVAPSALVEAALHQDQRSRASLRKRLVLAGAAAATLITLGGLASPAERNQPPIDTFVSRHVGVNAGNQVSGEVLFAVTSR